MVKSFILFFITAIAEIVGCYFVMKWVELMRVTTMYSVANTAINLFYAFTAIASLGLFAWLLTFHNSDAGRVYATYGGIYVFAAFLWLFIVDGVRPTTLDLLGVAMVLLGSFTIASQYLFKGN